MKLDPTVMRTMNRQDYRVLAAVERGMRDHALVPSPLIASNANLRHGGTHKILSSLLRDKLLSHDRSCGYDGYRLTNAGYDVLALHGLKTRKIVAALGDRIGTGKESDVYLAATPGGKQIVLKFHRLGRTSFRDVKKKRDYFNYNARCGNRRTGVYREQPNSWLFLSRTSSLKEYAFMKALHRVDYPTPEPLGHDRHVVAMTLVRGVPLYQLRRDSVNEDQARSIFLQAASLARRLARHGLVHCDLNEFNLMVDLSGGVQTILAGDDDVADHYVRHSGDMNTVAFARGELSVHGPLRPHRMDGTGEVIREDLDVRPRSLLDDGVTPEPVVTLIDFPQMVSTRHPNAGELYGRDVDCLKRFFVKKLRCFPPDDDGGWEDIIPPFESLIEPRPRPPPSSSATSVTTDGSIGDGGGDGASLEGEEVAAEGGDDGICLASGAQLRLDEELRASGYSPEDGARDAELYYYYNEESRRRRDDGADDGESEGESEGSDEEDHETEEDEDEDEGIEQGGSESDCMQTGATEQDMVSGQVRGDDNEDDEEEALRWAEAERRARERVKRLMDDGRRKGSRKGAFRSKNSNKTFVRGKRVMRDMGY